MEWFLVLLMALIFLRPEELQQLAKWVGKLWRHKTEWKKRWECWLQSLEK